MQDRFLHALELSKQEYNTFALMHCPGAQIVCRDLASTIGYRGRGIKNQIFLQKAAGIPSAAFCIGKILNLWVKTA